MDRPEDVEPSPLTGRIYIACTKSEDRGEERHHWSGRDVDTGVNAANPRPDNRSGHIIEITEAGDDATATRFEWDVFLLAGDPAEGRLHRRCADLAPGKVGITDTYFAGYPNRADVKRVHCPDNLGIDPQGRLWIVTDTDDHGRPNNGCFVMPTSGPTARPAAAAREWPGGLRGLRLRIHAGWTYLVPLHPAPGRRRHDRATRAAIGPTATACRRAPRCWPSSARTARRFDCTWRCRMQRVSCAQL